MSPIRRGLASLLAILLAVAALGPRAPARATPCEFNDVERIVAVGDVHGAYDRFLEILRAAEVIDASGKWSGGRTHLVQVGDVLDRGPDSRKALEFLRQLQREASRAGGRVHALLGNHEAMRIIGDFRYVTPGEYAAFETAQSRDVRRQLIESVPAGQRAQMEKDTPLGMVEMIRAFGPEQEYGAYLRGLNAVVRINGVVFVHGGISPRVAPLTCGAINDTVRRELGRDLDKTRRTPLKTLSASEDGPLWYRGLANEPDATFAPEVDAILAAQRAKAIVVGHTVQAGPLGIRFGGRVYLIDTGMQPAYQPDGRASALEIRGSVFTAIYKDGRRALSGGEPGGVIR